MITIQYNPPGTIDDLTDEQYHKILWPHVTIGDLINCDRDRLVKLAPPEQLIKIVPNTFFSDEQKFELLKKSFYDPNKKFSTLDTTCYRIMSWLYYDGTNHDRTFYGKYGYAVPRLARNQSHKLPQIQYRNITAVGIRLGLYDLNSTPHDYCMLLLDELSLGNIPYDEIVHYIKNSNYLSTWRQDLYNGDPLLLYTDDLEELGFEMGDLRSTIGDAQIRTFFRRSEEQVIIQGTGMNRTYDDILSVVLTQTDKYQYWDGMFRLWQYCMAYYKNPSEVNPDYERSYHVKGNEHLTFITN